MPVASVHVNFEKLNGNWDGQNWDQQEHRCSNNFMSGPTPPQAPPVAAGGLVWQVVVSSGDPNAVVFNVNVDLPGTDERLFTNIKNGVSTMFLPIPTVTDTGPAPASVPQHNGHRWDEFYSRGIYIADVFGASVDFKINVLGASEVICVPQVAVSNRTDQATKFVSTLLSANGGAAPYTWTASNLPPGMGIDSSSGVISGTPTQPSTYAVMATATDRMGHSGSASFSWTISPQIVTVPNVVGEKEANAVAAMRSIGLQPGPIDPDNQCIAPAGEVVSQSPAAGLFQLFPGASFRLAVSSGHDTGGKRCVLR